MTDERPIAQSRRDYVRGPLEIEELDEDPIVQFQQWFEEACKHIEVEPNAMTLATVDRDGAPAVRTVLLKIFDHEGFVFFTNLESRKAQHIDRDQRVALLFWWPELERQIEINGVAERISSAEAAKYFMTRPRGSQLGAWVSRQSQVLTSRKVLEMKLDEMKRKFLDGEVPLPSFWGGYRVVPHSVELWQGQPNRLHDRFKYEREGSGWRVVRLAP
ncbi:MAG: pyridoxamine 5'-phosphate oxidase [Deltaproteobacteria bacterium]|nr:pyridoxamine 5'-phosphate oxidase [Deltaproteobacteria bacterium]NND27267.1 pyridoxamine 5'-phosphate oxidase [Myxococcales bacterium]MBT8466300.1 pyridoxamine 5'-phosphate oxidase [Deltaproteobacteria bacterium]MBT8482591.1 pyridoxamine 5'-phosphate oxidase [Deltaproteobacteria bacterium]NNK08508.1 pyridoxamine 5'-phosphate oxidase [Myxococcales bacterium]